MRTRQPPKREFATALLVSLLVHLGAASLMVGLGTVLPARTKETQVEWTWTAPGPQAAKINDLSGVRPQTTPSRVSPTFSTAGTNTAKESVREEGTKVIPTAGPNTGQGAGSITGAAAGSAAAGSVSAGSAAGSTAVSAGAAGNSAAPTADSAELQVRGEGLAIVPPRLKDRPPIQLPPSLAQAGLTGNVLLLVEVKEDGRVGKISLSKSSGNRTLDELARDNVLQWLFVPAWQPQGNKPVRVSTSVWVRFGNKE